MQGDSNELYSDQTLMHRLELVKRQLDLERSSFIPHWKDIADFFNPRRPKFNVYDVNKGYKKNQNIIDGTGLMALRTLRAGMMSGITSPARPWFKLGAEDPGLTEYGPARTWYDQAAKLMGSVFLKSNLYTNLPMIYSDLGGFGTSYMHMEEDFEQVVSFQQFPIGSYWISNNSKYRVDVFAREFRMTARQMIQKFGLTDINNPRKIDWSKFSGAVKSAWINGNREDWFTITHFILPNDDYKPSSKLSKHKKYLSAYYESAGNGGANGAQGIRNDNTFLRLAGNDFFPGLAPRWEVSGEDSYGTNCPGMEAIGDNRQLQKGEQRSLQAIEKMVNPPMTAPSTMKNQAASILSGDITYVDIRDGQNGFRPAHEVRFDVDKLEVKQAQVRDRINKIFYADLFLQLSNSDRRDITATEIIEKKEEKLLALGPVLQQFDKDVLDPLIDNTFTIMLNKGLLPPPPPELQGKEIKVEYVSIMAQAQKLIGIGAVERFSGFVANIVTAKPEAADKVDTDQLIDTYADMVGIQSGIVRSDDDVSAIRQQRAMAQQAQVQAEQAQLQAATAKDLSMAKIEDDNALGAMLDSARAGALIDTEV